MAPEPSTDVEPAAPDNPGTENAAEPNEAPAPDKAGGGEAKKSCTELDKSTCKVTMGCVWNDVKKCIEQMADDQ
jgi:hypothetical protein